MVKIKGQTRGCSIITAPDRLECRLQTVLKRLLQNSKLVLPDLLRTLLACSV